MEQKIVFATGNEGKMREVRLILKDLGLPVLSRKRQAYPWILRKMEPHLRKMPDQAKRSGRRPVGISACWRFWTGCGLLRR